MTVRHIVLIATYSVDATYSGGTQEVVVVVVIGITIRNEVLVEAIVGIVEIAEVVVREVVVTLREVVVEEVTIA